MDSPSRPVGKVIRIVEIQFDNGLLVRCYVSYYPQDIEQEELFRRMTKFRDNFSYDMDERAWHALDGLDIAITPMDPRDIDNILAQEMGIAL